jgi:hypothetical protein
MVLKKVINAISDSCALDINLWFLDDGVIAGPAEEVSRALLPGRYRATSAT